MALLRERELRYIAHKAEINLALLPGESRELRVSYGPGATPGTPTVEAEAWNAPAVRR